MLNKIFKIAGMGGLIMAAGFSSAVTAQAQDQKTTEMYYIFDLKTDLSSDEISEAIRKGLKKNASKIQATSPLVMEPTPAVPGRFKIVDMADQFEGSSMAGLMALAQMNGGGAGLKTASCDGAVWIGRFTRDNSTQSLNITTCLFPYQGGYSLNVYGQDTSKKSGAGHRRLVEKGVAGLLGKPKKWTQKTFTRMRRKVFENTGVLMELQEGQPKVDFTFDDEPTLAVAPVASPAAPTVNCEGLSDAECGAAFRAAASQ